MTMYTFPLCRITMVLFPDEKLCTIMSTFSSMMLCMSIKNVINILMILCESYFFNVVFNRYLAGVAQDSGEPVLLRIAEEVMI